MNNMTLSYVSLCFSFCSFISHTIPICCTLQAPVTATTRPDPQPFSLAALHSSREEQKEKQVCCPEDSLGYEMLLKNLLPLQRQHSKDRTRHSFRNLNANPRIARGEKQPNFVFPALPQSDTVCGRVGLEVMCRRGYHRSERLLF